MSIAKVAKLVKQFRRGAIEHLKGTPLHKKVAGLSAAMSKRETEQKKIWKQNRRQSKQVRRAYTNWLKSRGAAGEDYRDWTNHVYGSLFNREADGLRDDPVVAGDPEIARNHLDRVRLNKVVEVERSVAQSEANTAIVAHQQALGRY